MKLAYLGNGKKVIVTGHCDWSALSEGESDKDEARAIARGQFREGPIDHGEDNSDSVLSIMGSH